MDLKFKLNFEMYAHGEDWTSNIPLLYFYGQLLTNDVFSHGGMELYENMWAKFSGSFVLMLHAVTHGWITSWSDISRSAKVWQTGAYNDYIRGIYGIDIIDKIMPNDEKLPRCVITFQKWKTLDFPALTISSYIHH